MERSLYPDSVEVDQTVLAYTESTKIAQLLTRTLALGQTGIVSGLTITINSVNTSLFDIAAGTAMVTNGELAIMASAQVSNPLASATLGALNFVMMNYVETEIGPEPSENGVDVEQTMVTSQGTISILTQSQYSALLPTQLATMAVIGIITATGGALSASNVTQSQPYISVLAPSQPVTVTGVEIVGIDYSTAVGTGLLEFNASPPTSANPTVPTPRIRWTAPGDTAPGAYVNIPTNGDYILTSNNGHTLTVSVIAVNLSLINQSDNITVQSLYSQPAPRATGADWLHRTYVGTGTPSKQNPHALSFEDLGGSPNGQVEQHQLLMHSNGIRRESNPIFLLCSVILVSGPSPDFISITNGIAGDVCLVDGVQLSAVTNTQIVFTSSVVSTIALYDLMIDSGGNPQRAIRVQHPASPAVPGVVVIDLDDAIGASSVSLTYDFTSNTLQWGNGTPILVRSDGNYILYDEEGNRVVLNVGVENDLGYGRLPSTGTTYVDPIQVFAPVDRTLNLQMAYVPWDGDHNLGWTILASNPRQPTDKRLFGTLGLPEIRDDVRLEIKEDAMATYTVGNGVTTFGDFNGSSGINAAIQQMSAAGITGSIYVKAGVYDPVTIPINNLVLEDLGGAVIDGVSIAETTGADITVEASFVTIRGFTLKNATYGIAQVSGNGNRGYGIDFDSTLENLIDYESGNNDIYIDSSVGSATELSVSSDETIPPYITLVLVNAAAGPVTVTLSPAASLGANIVVKKTDTTLNAVTIAADSGETIDNQSDFVFDGSTQAYALRPISGGFVIV